MTRYALALALAACQPRTRPPITCNVPPSPIDSATHAELIAARDAVWRAYYSGDSAQLVRILPERMVGMGESRADIIQNAQAFVRDGGKLTNIGFTCDEFYVAGNVAVVYSNYSTTTEEAGKSITNAGRAIEVFEKRDEVWVNPSWHLDPHR